MQRAEQENSTPSEPDRIRIPTFDTVEEEAAFWDTHDLTEFEDELEVVTDVRFVKAQPKKAITVRLPQHALDALIREARETGVAPSTLARMWILERLQATPQSSGARE